MPEVQHQISLRSYHTFHTQVVAQTFCEVYTIQDILELADYPGYGGQPWHILGGGSNVLFTQNPPRPVVKVSLPGIQIVRRQGNISWVRAGAGVGWHELVAWSLENNLAGLENLSLIPGLCGAAPMQNIGAYGVELEQVFDELEAIELATGTIRIFRHDECDFGYRKSIFKNELRDRYLITSITLKLHDAASAPLNLGYGDIRTVLADRNIQTPTPRDVSEAVIFIRKSKLPDPALLGNAGSFFKNPEVPVPGFDKLKASYPAIPGYPLDNGMVKVPAGWLIDNLGLKGFRAGDAGIHDRQALVLVNYGSASGTDILDVARMVQRRVEQTYGIELEAEVNII
ncbi:MAG: UDP-N-acetylmuramate dehydrogenase MurB [Bacteroidetes bacterium HLUCCA01]|nr:MAG: UDP-N-acetylmuramate dehydrogenase MurB [Bacteroidetes bacterium HLUCCA01]